MATFSESVAARLSIFGSKPRRPFVGRGTQHFIRRLRAGKVLDDTKTHALAFLTSENGAKLYTNYLKLQIVAVLNNGDARDAGAGIDWAMPIRHFVCRVAIRRKIAAEEPASHPLQCSKGRVPKK